VADWLAQGESMHVVQSLRENTTLIAYDHAFSHNIVSSGDMEMMMIEEARSQLQQLMWQYVSLCRDEEGLLQAKYKVQTLRWQLSKNQHTQADNTLLRAETINMLRVAELVIVAALERRESRGSHWRQDYQLPDQSLAGYHYAFQRLAIDPYGSLELQEEIARYA
jgi:L-aspartate oxidase